MNMIYRASLLALTTVALSLFSSTAHAQLGGPTVAGVTPNTPKSLNGGGLTTVGANISGFPANTQLQVVIYIQNTTRGTPATVTTTNVTTNAAGAAVLNKGCNTPAGATNDRGFITVDVFVGATQASNNASPTFK